MNTLYDQEVFINKSRISKSLETYFIADLAANHDGDLGRLKSLIWLAKDAGANAVKFQHFLADRIVSDIGFRSIGNKIGHQAAWKESVFDIYDAYHCRRNWTESLVQTCIDADIDMMTSPYDFDAVDLFAQHVAALKIGSGDITWLEIINKIAEQQKPVLLACGASTMDDVHRAVGAVLKCNRKLILMQCNTNYTADPDNFRCINLRVLKSFAAHWPGLPLGLSDHTLGHSTVLGAVTLGASVIEKHFTDDNERSGPDHKFAMNPETWSEMVFRTRELEAALRDGVKRIEPNESDTAILQRRAICVREDTSAGVALTQENLEYLRPCPEEACPPYRFEDVLGRVLLNPKQAHEFILWSDLD